MTHADWCLWEWLRWLLGLAACAHQEVIQRRLDQPAIRARRRAERGRVDGGIEPRRPYKLDMAATPAAARQIITMRRECAIPSPVDTRAWVPATMHRPARTRSRRASSINTARAVDPPWT